MSAPSKAILTKILGECTLFAGVSAADFATITDSMQLMQVPQGQAILTQGDTSKETFFLLSGKAAGLVVSEAGKEILFTEITPGSYFGELAALDGSPRSITISAGVDCVLASLSEETFCDMLLAYPQTAVNLATDLALRLRQMNARVYGLVVHDVDTRLRLHLMQMAQEQRVLSAGGVIEEVPTHEVLARYLGANREAVSRAMARLSKAGVISTERKRVTIADLEGLCAGLDAE